MEVATILWVVWDRPVEAPVHAKVKGVGKRKVEPRVLGGSAWVVRCGVEMNKEKLNRFRPKRN